MHNTGAPQQTFALKVCTTAARCGPVSHAIKTLLKSGCTAGEKPATLAAMTPTELFFRARAIFSQEQVAQHLNKGIRTIRRWDKRQSPVPKIAEASLRELLRGVPVTLAREDGAGYGKLPEFTFIDLFAGIGGTRLGFEAAGGRCVFTSEWDKYAAQTYRANHTDTHEIAGDITQVDARDIPAHDVLVAGFPCQPFSLAGVSKKNSLGRLHGFLDETQGTLFFDVARIIKTVRPRAFVLENVKNLRSHDGGRTFAVIMRTLMEELGYSVSDRIINAKGFVPQNRERVFIVGFRDGQHFNWDGLDVPDATLGPRLRAILHDPAETPELPYTEQLRDRTAVSSRYTLTDNLWGYLQRYAEKHRAMGNGFGCSVFGPDDVARTLSARYHKDGSEILIRQARRNPRRLTPRECARLMGFPDSFKIPVSDTRAYRQFGNSVVVPLVECVARGVAAVLRGDELPTLRIDHQMLLPGMVAEHPAVALTA